MFKRNEGILDRFVRVSLGIVFLPAGLFLLGGLQGNVPGLVFTGLGLLGLITGVSGVCPLYIPFGISTLENEREFFDKCKSMAATCMPGGNPNVGQMCGPMYNRSEKTHSSDRE